MARMPLVLPEDSVYYVHAVRKTPLSNVPEKIPVMTHCSRVMSVLALLSLLVMSSGAQAPPKREFRAAWVATVTNLDWPTPSLPPQGQQDQLVSIFESLKGMGFNAIIFQVRPECDALYNSSLEPWSKWLTGSQGNAPVPFWDPLEFAVEEAHKRGMELHAWFNPYRAERVVGNYPLASTHVVSQHPAWILTFAPSGSTAALNILNPGLPDVRNHVARVVADIVRRYDVDGIHADDYFYPYPPQAITNQDAATFTAYNRGFTDIGAWRRDNVNLLMKQIMDSVNAIKPYVRFGMSPFGIWKNGVPPGITGLDAYGTIYGDAIAWLREGSVDYFTPQLYWKIGGSQDYGKLMPWWADSVAVHSRHYYPGHIFGSYTNAELPNQLKLIRANAKVHGEVYFRASQLVSNSLGFADSLKNTYYTSIALSPVMAWKGTVPPNPPRAIRYARIDGTGQAALQWDLPLVATDGDTARRYVVYRFDHRPAGTELDNPANILAVVGKRAYVPQAPPPGGPYYYVVTALDHNHNEGDTSNVLLVAPPTPPIALAPINGSTGVADAARIIWSPTSPSSVYRLQIATDSTFASGMVVDDSTLADTSRAIAGLEGHMTFFWRVRAGNASGTGTYSSVSHFTTGFPAAPFLAEPPNLQLNVPLEPTFRWNAAPTASAYRFQISLMSDFSELTLDTSNIADTALAVSGLQLNRIYNWRVRASSGLGTSPWSPAFRFRTVQTSDVAAEAELPTTYMLSQNFPNPFNPTTQIRFAVPSAGRVVLTVFDVLGREETTLVDSDFPAGTYTVAWNASGTASGIYFYRMQSGSFVETKRMLLLR